MIELRGLTKDFGSFRAVDNISFEVPKGEILGFLGPNGAGKSTTMKMLTCFIGPTNGTALVAGHDIVKDPIKVTSSIGYLPESAPSYGEMTVCEFLSFIGEIRGMFGKANRIGIEKMRETCFLEQVWHQPIETLSKGFKQRVGFAQALIHDPQILILDEPTDGLDPNQKFEVRQLISRMGEAGKTIILSTHILEEVESVCNRVVIIANGKMVVDETPKCLAERSSLHNAVTMSFVNNITDSVRSDLSNIGSVEKVEMLDSEFPTKLRVFPKDRKAILSSVSDVIREKKWDVEQIHVEHGRLDEVFRKMTIDKKMEEK